MRTLTVHTADELVERWRRRAMKAADVEVDARSKAWDYTSGYAAGMAQAYRVAAAELLAILAASMEMEAAHHGDSEPETGWSDHVVFVGPTVESQGDPNALREWLAGERP